MRPNWTQNTAESLLSLPSCAKLQVWVFAVAKPWGDSDRYDIVLRFENTFWRVQIKSVLDKSPSRDHYRVQTADSRRHTYSAKDIDFLVAYIFAEDIWYVIPAHIVENKKSLCLTPGSKRSSIDQYREAWKLMMRCPGDDIATRATNAADGAEAARAPAIDSAAT
jgi:hypothetical protein